LKRKTRKVEEKTALPGVYIEMRQFLLEPGSGQQKHLEK